MAYTIGPLNTTDQYPADSDPTLVIYRVARCVRVDFVIQTNAIFYQLLDPGGSWLSERYLPGIANAVSFVSIDRYCVGVHVRSAAAGKSALVYVELLTKWDLEERGGS